MNVLLLGPYRQRMVDYIVTGGDSIVCMEDQITEDMPAVLHADWMISFGYRYIIRQEILKMFNRRAINMHISYLPWNRGADPNLWSFLEDTPKGVTIHLIDSTLDTGDIVAQKLMVFNDKEETLRTTYEKLNTAIEELFFEQWGKVKYGNVRGIPQMKSGTIHRSKDKERYMHLLTQGWDTPISVIKGKAL